FGCVKTDEDLETMSTLFTRTTLQLTGFSMGSLGWILSCITMRHSEWRLWLVDNATIFSSGVAQVGIWKICFPPHLRTSSDYGIVCCHEFKFNENFFPVEMFLAQVLLLIATFLGGSGIFFTFLPPWHFYRGTIHKRQATCLFLAGGIVYIITGLCVLVPVSWNYYSVATNKSIPFPPSFNLPSRPMAQNIGIAIPSGISSGLMLLISGIIFLYIRSPVMSVRVNPIIPRS
ncbi:claudin-34-like, partial [Pelodiscus sinensis]|uniref:claudin-34-like n=1 Tax=Pelodiscus sinensis TaxID=13735 RepID=UPI003F6B2A95